MWKYWKAWLDLRDHPMIKQHQGHAKVARDTLSKGQIYLQLSSQYRVHAILHEGAALVAQDPD
jgi:hypothetical protein